MKARTIEEIAADLHEFCRQKANNSKSTLAHVLPWSDTDPAIKKQWRWLATRARELGAK